MFLTAEGEPFSRDHLTWTVRVHIVAAKIGKVGVRLQTGEEGDRAGESAKGQRDCEHVSSRRDHGDVVRCAG